MPCAVFTALLRTDQSGISDCGLSVCMHVLQTRGFLTIEKPCDLRHRYASYTALQHKVLPFTHSASFQDTGKAWSNLLNFRPFKTKMKTVPLTQIEKIIFTTYWLFLGMLRWQGWANRFIPRKLAKKNNNQNYGEMFYWEIEIILSNGLV